MHWGIGQGQPDSKPEMGLLVTRSYRKRRNDQPEDNSRDTAKDPLARMGSLAGLVVHGRRSSAETDPPWRLHFGPFKLTVRAHPRDRAFSRSD
jgi:hypothetical protein